MYSKRELEVMKHLLSGLGDQAMANELNLSLQHTKFLIGNLYEKLGVKNRPQLIILYCKALLKVHAPKAKFDGSDMEAVDTMFKAREEKELPLPVGCAS